MGRPVDYRLDPFTDADESVLIERWGATIPSAPGPYEVWLPDIPREDDPYSIVVRENTGTVTIPASDIGDDTYLDEANPTAVNGTGTALVAGTTAGGSRRRILVADDLSGSPTRAARVTLRLYCHDARGGAAQQFGVHQVTGGWTEGSATWNSPPPHESVAADTTTVYGVGWYEWDITSLYNGWKDGSITNYGVLIKHGNEASLDTYREFSACEHGTAGQRPSIVVEGQGTAFTEVEFEASPGALEFRTNYGRGVLGFNVADAGKSIFVDYYSRGSHVKASDVGALTRYLGSGADGELNVLTGTTTLTSYLYSYTRIHVAPGATLTITGGSKPVVVGCTGDVEIFGNLNLDGKGGAGGAGGGAYQDGAPGGGFAHTGGRGGQGAKQAVSITNDPISPADRGAILWGLIAYLSNAIANPSISEADTLMGTYWTRQFTNSDGISLFVTDLTAGGTNVIRTAPAFGGFLKNNTAGQNTALTSYLTTAYGTGSQLGGVVALADYLAGAYDTTTSVAAIPVGGGGGGGALTAGTAGSDGGGNVSGAGGEAHHVTSDGIEEFARPLPGGGGGGAGGDASSGGAGGAGGGAMLLQIEGELFVDANATLTARGSAAAGTNGGGGGGGAIHIRCNRRRVNVTPTVTGGAGNNRGGNGAPGWYLIEDLEPTA